MDDVDRLRAALADVERRARDLPWARERAWTVATHVWWESAVPTIDLHDLSVRLGVAAVEALDRTGADLQSGAVRLITGRGRHAPGGSRLRRATTAALRDLCVERGWEWRPSGPGRLLLVVDPSLAPAEAWGQLGPLFWLVVLLFVAGLVVALWTAG